jgi:hypothetical protein
MSLHDPQLARWVSYAALSAVLTLLFIAVGTAGMRWIHRVATRIAVISSLVTVFCLTAGLSTFVNRDPGPPSGDQQIEWCKRVSCTLDANTTAPGRR